MQTLSKILGYASDPEIAEKLHALGHADRIETIQIARDDTHRHRLRIATDRGTDCAIALPRDQRLSDGAVLALESERAIVVRLTDERWLTLRARDAAAGLALGYFCGNLHWRVKFDNDSLRVALEGPEADYLARLRPFLADGRAWRLEDD